MRLIIELFLNIFSQDMVIEGENQWLRIALGHLIPLWRKRRRVCNVGAHL